MHSQKAQLSHTSTVDVLNQVHVAEQRAEVIVALAHFNVNQMMRDLPDHATREANDFREEEQKRFVEFLAKTEIERGEEIKGIDNASGDIQSVEPSKIEAAANFLLEVVLNTQMDEIHEESHASFKKEKREESASGHTQQMYQEQFKSSQNILQQDFLTDLEASLKVFQLSPRRINPSKGSPDALNSASTITGQPSPLEMRISEGVEMFLNKNDSQFF